MGGYASAYQDGKMVEPSRRTTKEPKVPNTDTRFGATPVDTRDDIRTAQMAIEAQTAHGDTEAVQAWTERLNRLVDEAHEQAHRENERRWAVEQTEALGMGTYGEDTEAVQDLLVQVRRNWRLSREASKVATYAQFSQYATLSGSAATELENEFGIEVAWTVAGVWTVEAS